MKINKLNIVLLIIFSILFNLSSQAKSLNSSFRIYKQESRFYIELSNSCLNRDILIVTRISKAPSNRVLNPFYAGTLAGSRVIRFSKGSHNKLYVLLPDFTEYSNDSTKNGMLRSVNRTNQYPIAAVFDILSGVSFNNITIDVTDLLNSDSELIFFSRIQSKLEPGVLQSDRSLVEKLNSNDTNLEVYTQKTYNKGGVSATYELFTTVSLLERVPMPVRYADYRVGYFSYSRNDFDINPNEAKTVEIIKRFRIEPKSEDMVRYEKGELVEPKKPIVFYIDPTMPRKWVPYIKSGISAWENAFEKAGFKKAIRAIEIAETDDFFSMKNGIKNLIVWNPTLNDNASGSVIIDPRSGEILQAYVELNHNELKWQHDKHFILASPTDARARSMHFDDDLMGKLIQQIVSHEVGHALGLSHNHSASETVTTKQLRDKRWVEKNGFSPSIMEYARYNYVAQPKDGISRKGMMCRVGVYDEWAIEWGYRWLPKLDTYDKEKDYMNRWIAQKVESDKRLFYSIESGFYDKEDLCDDIVDANNYGIENLKIVIDNLSMWTKDGVPGDYKIIYGKIVDLYKVYLMHIVGRVGSKYTSLPASLKNNLDVQFLEKSQQQQALQFLQEQVFSTPNWLLNRFVSSKSGTNDLYSLLDIQIEILTNLLSIPKLENLLLFEHYEGPNAYTVEFLLKELSAGIFMELQDMKPIDMYRRNLQKAYIRQVVTLNNDLQKSTVSPRITRTDLPTTLENHIEELLKSISAAIPIYNDSNSILHLKKLQKDLKNVLKNEPI